MSEAAAKLLDMVADSHQRDIRRQNRDIVDIPELDAIQAARRPKGEARLEQRTMLGGFHGNDVRSRFEIARFERSRHALRVGQDNPQLVKR